MYEFAISKGTSDRRYKMYVGETNSVRSRHQQYAKTGDHLYQLLDTALKDGCVIWRRCQYVVRMRLTVMDGCVPFPVV